MDRKRQNADFANRLAQRDESVVAAIIAAYERFLRKKICSIIGTHAHDDDVLSIIHDAVLIVWDYFDQNRGATVLRYLTVVAVNEAKSELKKRLPENGVLRGAQDELAASQFPRPCSGEDDDPEEFDRQREMVFKAMGRLTPRQRDALMAKYRSGSFDWASKYGVAEGASSRACSKTASEAMKRLRDLLKSEGMEIRERMDDDEGPHVTTKARRVDQGVFSRMPGDPRLG